MLLQDFVLQRLLQHPAHARSPAPLPTACSGSLGRAFATDFLHAECLRAPALSFTTVVVTIPDHFFPYDQSMPMPGTRGTALSVVREEGWPMGCAEGSCSSAFLPHPRQECRGSLPRALPWFDFLVLPAPSISCRGLRMGLQNRAEAQQIVEYPLVGEGSRPETRSLPYPS